jgi:hypothetical protein
MREPDIEPYLPYAFITGYVYNSVSNATIQNATVTLSRVPGSQDLTTKSDPTGYYFFELPELYYPDTSTTLTGSAFTYKTGYPEPLIHRLGYVVDAHGYGKRFIVRADELLTAFVELQLAMHEFAVSLIL